MGKRSTNESPTRAPAKAAPVGVRMGARTTGDSPAGLADLVPPPSAHRGATTVDQSPAAIDGEQLRLRSERLTTPLSKPYAAFLESVGRKQE